MNGYDTDTMGEDMELVLRLLDCMIKHRNMIANPLYGVLGLVTMSYQLVFELLGPICSILFMLWPWFRNMFPGSWLLWAGYAGLKLGCAIVADYFEVDKDVWLLLKSWQWTKQPLQKAQRGEVAYIPSLPPDRHYGGYPPDF